MKLLVVVVVLVVGASARSSVIEIQDGNKSQSTSPSCPKAADIQPCVCTLSSDGFLDMNCSLVQNKDELKKSFQAEFPSPAFRRFTLHQNKRVHTLDNDTFGVVSFEEIWMTEGVLQWMEVGTLDGSSSTARSLVFNRNVLVQFPFAAIEGFTQLLSLDLRLNTLMYFPVINSSTLEILYLSSTVLGGLSVDAFAGMPSLVYLDYSDSGITYVSPGTFEGLTSLRRLAFGNNLLRELLTNAIQCNSNTTLVDIGYSNIEKVEPGAFPGLKGARLYIHHNFITTLEEEVWRPLVDFGGYLNPSGNPLVCGCDISWLLHNATLLNAVDDYTTCADGRMLKDLDPADYDHCFM